jgi:hypothetical protein
MSHHIHMLPGIIPVDRPLPSGKKRRIRKARASSVGQTGGIAALDDDDEEFYLSAEEADEASAGAGLSSSGPMDRFSSETMKALLEVQESL